MLKFLFLIVSISVFASGQRSEYTCESIDHGDMISTVKTILSQGQTVRIKALTKKYVSAQDFEETSYYVMRSLQNTVLDEFKWAIDIGLKENYRRLDLSGQDIVYVSESIFEDQELGIIALVDRPPLWCMWDACTTHYDLLVCSKD
jgi:hypothetical protein